MKIQDMHYDFKKKLNKVDSQQNRNLLIPEIDWVLNEALNIFIANSASPRVPSTAGFELSQRFRDDLYPLVNKDVLLPLNEGVASLPEDYLFYIRAKVLSSNDKCSNVESTLVIQQFDDKFEESPFTKSSLEWREVNGVFSKEGITTYTDGTFTNNYISLTYLRKPKYIHYAKGFSEEGYKLPSGIKLEESQDCELPSHTHSTIVDIAVAITSGELHYQDAQMKYQKLQIKQFQ